MGVSMSCTKPTHSYDILEVREMFPFINDTKTLIKYIEYAKKENHYELIKEKFKAADIIDFSGNLTTGLKPFNVFARIANGDTENIVNQNTLGNYKDRFVICHNLPKNDLNWDNPDFPTASMAGPDEYGPGHVFITTRNLDYSKFNILPIIIDNDVKFICDMLCAAITYTSNRGWENPGFYFHCYPHNSVQSLHLHVINHDMIGPSFVKQIGRNLDIYHILNAMSVPHNMFT